MRSTARIGVVAAVGAAAVALGAWAGGPAPAPGGPSGIHLASSDEESVAVSGDGEFDLEIDAELDAQFGDRPVNAVEAAAIAVDRFGGRVVEAELDESGGRPIWEIEMAGAAVGEIEVDAIDGAVLSGGDDD